MIKHLHFMLLSVLMMAFGMSASAQDVKFVFNEANSYEQFGLKGWSFQADDKTGAPGSDLGDITADVTLTQGTTTLTVTPNDGSHNRMWKSGTYYNLRLYGGKMIITSDKNITKIVFANYNTGDITPNVGTIDYTPGSSKDNVCTWTAEGDTKSVEFSFKKNKKNNFINTVTVTLGEGGGVTPDPEPTPTPTPGEEKVIYTTTFDNQAAIDAWTVEGYHKDEVGFKTLHTTTKSMQIVSAMNAVTTLETSYIVSPIIKLEAEGNKVTFNHSCYDNSILKADALATFAVREKGGNWIDIPGLTHGDGTNWRTFVNAGTFNVPAELNGKEVQFGFRYKWDGDQNTLNWYIKDIKVFSDTSKPEEKPAVKAENIAAFTALGSEDGVKAELTLKDAKVNYVNKYGKNIELYISDASGALLFRNSGLDYKLGDVLNGKIIAKSTIFQGMPQLAAVEGETNADSIKAVAGETPVAEEMSVENAIKKESLAKLVHIKDVKVYSKKEGEYTNYYMQNMDGRAHAIGLKNIFKIEGFNEADYVDKDSLEFTGILKYQYGGYKLAPTVVPGGDKPAEEIVANNIKEFKANMGKDLTLKLNNAKVLYVNEFVTSKKDSVQEVYIQDETGALMLYNMGLKVANGDVINGTIKGNAKDYFDMPEMVSNKETNTDNLKIEKGEAAEPIVMALDKITMDDLARLVKVENVEVTMKEEKGTDDKMHKNYYMKDEKGTEVCVANKFKLEGVKEADLVGKKGLTFVGIIKYNFGKITLCMIQAPTETTGIEAAEAELNTNAPMYNLQGMRVDANFKGIIIQNGKKFINK